MKIFRLEEQYEKFSEMKRTEVRKLLEWFETQPHFPKLLEEEVMVYFYACYYSTEMTKQVLDTNLTVREHVTFFHNYDCDLPAIQRAMKTVAIAPLPQHTPNGYRVIMSKIVDTNVAHFHLADLMKLYNLVYDMWIMEDGLCVGDIAVLNMEGSTFAHLGRMNVVLMRQFLYYMQEATPVRLAGIHFVNVNAVLDKFLIIITPFLKQEIKDILHFHTTMEGFYKFVPKDMLPNDYGGLELSSDELANNMYKRLQTNRNHMITFAERFHMNNKLRPEKTKIINDLFGIEGNFRKLDID